MSLGVPLRGPRRGVVNAPLPNKTDIDRASLDRRFSDGGIPAAYVVYIEWKSVTKDPLPVPPPQERESGR
jgi:hypothetical protein